MASSSEHKADIDTTKDNPAANETDLGDLESLEGDEYADMVWYVYRLTGKDGRRLSDQGSYVAKLHGPLDLDTLRSTVGGGCFRIFGRGARGSKISPVRRIVDIEGPTKSFDVQATTDPVAKKKTSNAVVAIQSEHDERLEMLSESIDRLTEHIVRQNQVPTQPPPMTVQDIITLAKQLQPPPITESVLAAFTKGLDIGMEKATIAEPESDLASMVKAFAPALAGLMAAKPHQPIPATRVQQPAAQTPQDAATRQNVEKNDRGQSEAVVVDSGATVEASSTPKPPVTVADGPNTGQTSEKAADDGGIILLAQVLANGLRRGTSPEDMAYVLTDLMDDDQIEMMTQLGHQSLLDLATANGVQARVPDIAHADMPVYLERVLTALASE